MGKSGELGNRYFRAFGTMVVGHRWTVLLLIGAVTAGAIYQIRTKLYVDNSPEAFMDSGGEAARVLEDFRDVFGRDDVFLVLVEGDVFSLPFLTKLKALHTELESIDIKVASLGERKASRDARRGRPTSGPHEPKKKPAAADDDFAEMDTGGDEWAGVAGGSVVDEVISLINVRKIRTRKDGIDVGDLMKPMPTTEAEVAALRREVLGDPSAGMPPDTTLVGQVVGRDGRHAAIVVRTDFMSQPDSVRVNEHVLELLERHKAPGFSVHLAGMPPMVASLQSMMLGDMQVLVMVSLGTIGLILLFMFVHPMGAIVPLMVVAVSAIWTLGLMATLGIPMTVISNILPAFLVCVGVADAVHLISIYRQGLLAGSDTRAAAIDAIADTGVPVFFTSLTTAVGLMSFKFASVDAIGEMGAMGAFGVGAAFVNTLTLLPAMLSFNKRSLMGADRARRMGAVDGLLRLCSVLTGQTVGRRRATLGIALGLTAVAIFGATKLYVWHDPLSWLPKDTPVKVAFALTDEKLGGTANVQLLIDAEKRGGIKDIEVQAGLVALEKYLRAFVHPKTGDAIVGNVRSVVDIVRETNRALKGGDRKFYRVPDSQEAVNDRFFLVESSGPDDLKRLLTLDAKTTQMTIGMKWLEASSYQPLADYVIEGVKKYLPAAKVTVSMTGTVFNFLSTVGMLIRDLIRSFSVAFAVITLIMILLLRNIKLGLIAMVPNLLPIAYIMGIMGIGRIPIDMANLMIASIALGIAVDDTIHLLHHFKVHHDRYGDTEAAIQHALEHTGRALVVTSIILALGFFVYLSSQMLSLQRFGALIGLTVILALLLDLILTPALLRMAYLKSDAAARAS